MSTTITLMQAALVLGVSFSEISRLVRQRKLAVACVVNRVKYVDATSVLGYIRGTQP